jgi:CheY-like chemotaxis protein
VLSLDDNPDILSILRLCLEGSYEFWGTDDEAAAMCLLSFADRIDVFTQDLERPCGIGGCEFLRLLRAHPKLREIPVLLISGYPASAIRERLEGAGIPIDRNVAFLAKPFTRTQLRFTIRSMLPGDVN